MAKEARKRHTKRRALQIGIGIPALILIVFGLVRLFGNDDSSNTRTTATTVTSIDTSTTAAAGTDGDASTTSVAGGGTPLACPAADGSSTKTTTFPAAPEMCIDVAKKYSVKVETSLGTYTADLDPSKAPLAVNSFVYLARYHYFDGTPCHRIITGFVIQCGDPTGSG